MSRYSMLAGGLLLSLMPVALLAQDPEHSWEKSFAVVGSPVLAVETADSDLAIRSCGDCRAVRIQVESGRKLSEYRLEESQGGDTIHFSLKEKPHYGLSLRWGPTEHSPRVTIEAPTALTLDARTVDGSLALRDLRGDLQVHSGDGSIDIVHTSGALKLVAGDGNVQIHDASGTLDARASDGRMTVDGTFTAVQLHTSDGKLELSLADGSQLARASSVASSDGQVSIRVPHSLAADLDVTTSDGRIDCSLPLTMDHFNSNDRGAHHVHGRLNAGGVPLTVRTSDGNVTIAAL